MRVRNMFDRIGRYRLGVVLTMPLWVMALVRIASEDIHIVTWRLVLFLVGAGILIWAVVADAWYVYAAKRKMRKMMDSASRPRRRNKL